MCHPHPMWHRVEVAAHQGVGQIRSDFVWLEWLWGFIASQHLVRNGCKSSNQVTGCHGEDDGRRASGGFKNASTFCKFSCADFLALTSLPTWCLMSLLISVLILEIYLEIYFSFWSSGLYFDLLLKLFFRSFGLSLFIDHGYFLE